MRKMWIYDDINRLGRNYSERLNKMNIVRDVFDVKSMSDKQFKDEMKILTERQKKLRLENKWDYESIFDKTSIFIIDWDLLRIDPFLTGSNVAYLARCYSKCGLIIALNMDVRDHVNLEKLKIFDLKLKGYIESFADFDITSKELDNPGLWGGETTGYRPWYWPNLPEFLESYEKRVKEIISHEDDAICEFLGFKDIVYKLPRSITQFLGDYPEKTTFKEFVLNSGNALRGRDENPTYEMIQRIAAARISKWLERLVLPRQDILVDAPHLVSRYPSLLKGDRSEVDTWNKTANFDTVDSMGLDHERIKAFRFKKEYWMSRPVWFWEDLSECQEIKEVSEPWEREVTKYVFCEDSSSFHEREDCKEFVMDSDSPYIRRFVKYFEDVDYRPRMRLT